jgi:hypothetical protein
MKRFTIAIVIEVYAIDLIGAENIAASNLQRIRREDPRIVEGYVDDSYSDNFEHQEVEDEDHT